MTRIEWADRVWNPIIGCEPISPGCAHCYARAFARRLAGQGIDGYRDVAKWDGTTRLIERRLDDPTRWRKPLRIFLGSMTDLFHRSTPFEWVDRVLEATRDAPHHTYLILTKRADRMREYFARGDGVWPWVWVGASIENQERAREQIPSLLNTPAALRFVSYEPAIGPVDLWGATGQGKIGWIIAGAETGPGKRNAEAHWFRDLLFQCRAAGVPFFFKKDAKGNRELCGKKWEEIPR